MSYLQLDPKRNSFGLVRLLLALTVIYAHAWELGGFGHDPIFRLSGQLKYSLGAIAVDGFFALSGCLITASFLRTQSLHRFLWHRALRILPGYWMCIFTVAIGLPLLFGQMPHLEYAMHNLLVPLISPLQSTIGLLVPLVIGWAPNVQSWIDKIPVLQIQTTIFPLLNQNPIPDIVNGSLWSLEQEIRLYLVVAILGGLGLLRKRYLIGVLLLSWAGYCFFFLRTHDLAAVSPLRASAHFLMGAVFCFWQPSLKPKYTIATLMIAILAFVTGLYPIVSPFTTAFLMTWLGNKLPMHGFGRKHDYSYGLYIYAFPIQQALTAAKLNQWGFLVYFGLCTLCALVPAVLSWHFVERSVLRLKDAWMPHQHFLSVAPESVPALK